MATNPALAADATTATPPNQQAELEELAEVVVYASDGTLVEGLYAESELDAAGVAAYGADTVGDLISQVAPDVDNTEEGPVILINGKPANGIRSVNDLPSESVQSVQVLPPQAAAALGYGPTRRVINVVLKQSFRQGTGNLTLRGATAGQGRSGNGNVSTLRLNGNNIRNLSVRINRTDPLREIHRGIQSQTTAVPYDLVGNVLSWPATGAEIDPALSALAGEPVTVLGMPVTSLQPELADLVPFANVANVSNLGRYRTLVSDQTSFGINGNWGMALGPGTSLNLNFNAERGESWSLTGATPALLHVPATSPFTPFGDDVALARYVGEPLRQDSSPTTLNLSANLSRQMGRFRMQFDSGFTWRSNTTVSERRVDTAALQAAIDAGTVNPFLPVAGDLLGEVATDRARSRNFNGVAALAAYGALFDLPAGKANASMRLEVSRNEQRSRTTGTTMISTDRSRQDELAQFSMQLPIVGSPQPQGFAMAGELSGSARQVTAAGTLLNHGYGLNWRLGTRFSMRVGFNREQVAPQPEALTGPVVTIDDFRAYDFIRQETVLVRYITGGNPDLATESRRITRLGGTWRPFTRIDLSLNAEYLRTVGRNVLAALPPVSEDVQAAFPDRYRRDADGRLVEIDARQVSFTRSRTGQLRWGGNFRRTFGNAPPMTPNVVSSGGQMIVMDTSGDDLSGAGWRTTANFTHTWQLESTRLARPGLPEQDLLAGGTGTGNGQSRHNVQSRLGLAYNGTGLQLNANWRNRSYITAGTTSAPNNIVFHSFLRLDLQAFANLGTVYPGNALVKGVRLSLGVDNLLDAKQRVTDDTGTTPLRYQPYLINALGRVVSLSLRKTF